jgi:predicted phosphohydrolase
MIRLAILSDLHVEKGEWTPPPLDCDLVVLAGDIGWGAEGIAWIERHLAGRRMVMVAGNREYWHHPEGRSPITELQSLAAAVPGLTLLQNQAVILDMNGRRLRLLGTTLWTDYSLDGDAAATMAKAGETMPDYRNGSDASGKRLTPDAVRNAGRQAADFLATQLAVGHDGPSVVITHHLPSELGLPRRRPGHVPQAASVLPLEDVIRECGPQLWVHGHSHADCDYVIGRTRIVSRQRGTPENIGFEPLLIEL